MLQWQQAVAFRLSMCVLSLLLVSIDTVVGSSATSLPQTRTAPEICIEFAPFATPIGHADSGESFDLWYLTQAIEGHAAAISAASVGLQRASNSDVRRMALRVAESQAGELQLLRSWRTVWYSEMGDTTMGTDVALQVKHLLECSSTSEFDATFLRTMISLHQTAIALANEASQHSDQPELRSFAQSTVAARETELRLMTDLVEELSASYV